MDVTIDRVDPERLDLDTADAVADVLAAAGEADGLPFLPRTGADVLTTRQLGFDGRPVRAVLLARDGDGIVGDAFVDLPVRENADTASVQVTVHPAYRRRGIGGALWSAALEEAGSAGRRRVHTGAWVGTVGVDVLERWGAQRSGVGVIRRIGLHDTPPGHWNQVREEAAAHATGYALEHHVGSTPEQLRGDVVALHAAINDAPRLHPDDEASVWDEERLLAYERAMAGRRQTLYRVVARHRGTGEPAGHSLVCVDEFTPAEAVQEDTAVVLAHRGHRLGLLMKAEMLSWLARDRPEVAHVDTWNNADNHHMIAINERLGARVVARRQTFTLAL
jgi:GNAT superfamily N-acetyltransferase